MRGLLWKLSVLVVFVAGSPVCAGQEQDGQDGGQTLEQGQAPRQAATGEGEAETVPETGEQDEETGENGEETSEEGGEEVGEGGEFERFIPTEQVSRDLGVSFPADI